MKQTTEGELLNLWLEPYHGTTIEIIAVENPDRVKAGDSEWFYKTYAVTQSQHDEWYDGAIELLAKRTRRSKKHIRRAFALDYLNVAPAIKET